MSKSVYLSYAFCFLYLSIYLSIYPSIIYLSMYLTLSLSLSLARSLALSLARVLSLSLSPSLTHSISLYLYLSLSLSLILGHALSQAHTNASSTHKRIKRLARCLPGHWQALSDTRGCLVQLELKPHVPCMRITYRRICSIYHLPLRTSKERSAPQSRSETLNDWYSCSAESGEELDQIFMPTSRLRICG